MSTPSHRRSVVHGQDGTVGRAVRLAGSAVVAAAVALAPAVAFAPVAHGADGAALSWKASLGDRDVGSATSNQPIRLDPAQGSVLVVNVKNTGSTQVAVHDAVLEGRVIGLPFFSYRTRLNITLPPGQEAQRRVELDLSDLGDQATGLIPTRVRLLGANRNVLATRSFVTDVRGRALSVYGVFGLVIAVVTVLMLLGLALTLSRGRLPENRWQRAMQFLPAGVGIGFVATFTLSATRVLAPSPTLWVPLVLVCGAGAFILGYLAPGPDSGDDTDGPGSLPSQRSRRAEATTAAVGAGGVAALFAEHQADAGGVGTYDDGQLHDDASSH